MWQVVSDSDSDSIVSNWEFDLLSDTIFVSNSYSVSDSVPNSESLSDLISISDSDWLSISFSD